jgi:hypothetical protein
MPVPLPRVLKWLLGEAVLNVTDLLAKEQRQPSKVLSLAPSNAARASSEPPALAFACFNLRVAPRSAPRSTWVWFVRVWFVRVWFVRVWFVPLLGSSLNLGMVRPGSSLNVGMVRPYGSSWLLSTWVWLLSTWVWLFCTSTWVCLFWCGSSVTLLLGGQRPWDKGPTDREILPTKRDASPQKAPATMVRRLACPLLSGSCGRHS